QADSMLSCRRTPDVVVILSVRADVAGALTWINRVMADKAGEQRVFDWRWREVAVVGGMQYGLRLIEVIRQPDTRTGLHAGVDQVEIIIANAKIERQIADCRDVILDVSAGLYAKPAST